MKSLLTKKLTKGTLAEVQNKYLRPENCTNFVAPKINKQIWQQLRQETRNNDSAFQKAQSLLLSGLYAVLQLCNSANGDQRNVLTPTAVQLLSANRELNLKRRDLIRPDLNKQYGPLCNPSTAVSTFLFGDDLNKEVKELTKSQKLSNKVNPKRCMEPYKVPASRGVCRRGRFSQSAGRGRAPSNSFLGQGLGHTRPPAESQDLGNQDPVGSPAEVSQTTLATIIAIKFLLRLEDCETVFMYGRLSHQILLSLMQLLIVILNLTGNLEYILVLLGLLVPLLKLSRLSLTMK